VLELELEFVVIFEQNSLKDGEEEEEPAERMSRAGEMQFRIDSSLSSMVRKPEHWDEIPAGGW
jgi:hypothetical protein